MVAPHLRSPRHSKPVFVVGLGCFSSPCFSCRALISVWPGLTWPGRFSLLTMNYDCLERRKVAALLLAVERRAVRRRSDVHSVRDLAAPRLGTRLGQSWMCRRGATRAFVWLRHQHQRGGSSSRGGGDEGVVGGGSWSRDWIESDDPPSPRDGADGGGAGAAKPSSLETRVSSGVDAGGSRLFDRRNTFRRCWEMRKAVGRG